MSKDRDNWDINTRLNHPERIYLQEGNIPLLQPVYRSAKFTYSENSSGELFVYGRVSNPTTRQLEKTLAEIQKREDCIVVSSGISAITVAFLGILKAGDHIIIFRELYKPARMFVREILPRYGITHSIISLKDIDKLETLIKPETKLIHFESPTNPNLDIADIEFITRIAGKHHVMVSMDGTFGGLHQHTDYNLDIVIHSLTKYGNGHGDVIAGCISGKKDVIKRIRETSVFLGSHLDPDAAYLIQRGLKTYLLRYERQSKTAAEIAAWLKNHQAISAVRYPGMGDDKNVQLARKQMKDMGGVVSFEIKKEVAASAEKFCHKLKLIQLAASIGSTESIICPTLSFFGTDLTNQEREEMGLTTHSLRLSVGLEDTSDLISDLEQALRY